MVVHVDVLRDGRAVHRRLVVLHDVGMENAHTAHFELYHAVIVKVQKAQVSVLMVN